LVCGNFVAACCEVVKGAKRVVVSGGRASEGARGKEGARKAKRKTELERAVEGKLGAIVGVRQDRRSNSRIKW
jgi:hypothetical protein